MLSPQPQTSTGTHDQLQHEVAEVQSTGIKITAVNWGFERHQSRTKKADCLMHWLFF
jgi:hypothetical protein